MRGVCASRFHGLRGRRGPPAAAAAAGRVCCHGAADETSGPRPLKPDSSRGRTRRRRGAMSHKIP